MLGFDMRDMRDACGSFATGVTVITTTGEDGDHGMTANAFMSVSLDPPMVSISLDRKCKMLGRIRASGRYAVSILPEQMENVALHFAGRPDPALSEIFDRRGTMPVIRDASAIFLADVAQEVNAGDHTLFIGKVTHLERNPDALPLTFCAGRFGALAR
ncbi:NADH-dependent flavin reductase (plasmid) [Marinibacterium anthonyi]|nr:NADH-dependent flavin reductase [Marinibacterium anthonyi]